VWALDKIQNSQSFEAILQGLFSVDSFFFLSGLLVSYIFITKKDKIKNFGFLFWIKFVVHRFLRILPPYLALVVLVEPLSYYACLGPLCPPQNFNCADYWWRNLLNINNFFQEGSMCAGWTWYLANDFQFFLISPIFLTLMATIPALAATLLCSTLAASWMATVLPSSSTASPTSPQVYVTDHPGGVFGSSTFDIYYDKPWCRAGPYLIGLATGWLIAGLRSRKLKPTTRRWLGAGLGWTLAAALNLSLVYGVYHANLAGAVGKLNLSLSRTAWAVGLAWVTAACVTGYGGPVNWVTSRVDPKGLAGSSVCGTCYWVPCPCSLCRCWPCPPCGPSPACPTPPTSSTPSSSSSTTRRGRWPSTPPCPPSPPST